MVSTGRLLHPGDDALLEIPAFLRRPPMTPEERRAIARRDDPANRRTVWTPEEWARRAAERTAVPAPARPTVQEIAPAPAPSPKAKVGIIAMLKAMMQRKGGATIQEMHDALVEAFPDRDPKGMLSTVKIQVKRQGADKKGDRYRLGAGK